MGTVEKLLWLSFAGILGTLARYGLSGIVLTRSNMESFPWGTFVVNMLGSFLFGVFWPLAEDRMLISSDTRQVILVGFMGAFTTFSTFAFETGMFLRDGQYLMAGLNMAVQNAVGILCLLLGMAAGRLL